MLSIEKSVVLKLHKSNLVQCTKTTFMVDRATFTDMAGLFWPIVFCKWCFAALSFITWWTMHAILGFFCNLSTTVTKCMWDICLGGFTWDQPVVFVLCTGCPNLNWDLKTKFSDLNILRLSIQVFHVRKILSPWNNLGKGAFTYDVRCF